MNDTRPAIQFNYIALASRETAQTMISMGFTKEKKRKSELLNPRTLIMCQQVILFAIISTPQSNFCLGLVEVAADGFNVECKLPSHECRRNAVRLDIHLFLSLVANQSVENDQRKAITDYGSYHHHHLLHWSRTRKELMTLANVTINTLLMNAINKSGQFILVCTRGGKAARIVAPDPVGGFLLFKLPTASIVRGHMQYQSHSQSRNLPVLGSFSEFIRSPTSYK